MHRVVHTVHSLCNAQVGHGRAEQEPRAKHAHATPEVEKPPTHRLPCEKAARIRYCVNDVRDDASTPFATRGRQLLMIFRGDIAHCASTPHHKRLCPCGEVPMPRFDSNLSFLFNEVPFLDRFAEAAHAGFEAVEFAFGYDHPVTEIAARLSTHGLKQILINAPPGDLTKGDRRLAAWPGREQ